MGEESSAPRLRSRQCQFVLYPESQQEVIEYVQENFPCAWALHDKDKYSQAAYDAHMKKFNAPPEWKPGDLKKPHVHFVCYFKNARYFTGIAKELNARCKNGEITVNAIRRVNNLYKAYTYLWHDGHTDKYQYPPEIVGTHEFEVPSEQAGVSAAEDEQVKTLLGMPKFASVNEMARWAYENGCWAAFRKNYSLWRDCFSERNNLRSAPKPPPEIFSEYNKYRPTDVDWPE